VSGRRALAVAVLVVGVAVLGATPASARRAAQPSGDGADARDRIELVAQDAWTPIGGDLHLRVRIPDSLATPDATLSLVAYQQVTTRAAFDRVVQSGSAGSVLDQVVVPVALLAAGEQGARDITVGIEANGDARDPARLSLRRTGVYPLAVEVLDAEDRSQGRVLTMAVAVAVDALGAATNVAERLGVAWTWPLVAGPSTLPDGSADPVVTRALRPSGRLGRQAVALTRAGDVPLTLVPGPETLETWARQGADDPSIARGAAAVRDASGRDQIVTGPYVPSDLPSLLSVGLDTTVDAELVRGDETLARLLGTRPDVRTALARPVDAGSLARLRARGVDRVIIDGDALAASNRAPSTRPFLLQPAASLVPSGPITALAGDIAIERLLTGDGTPALRAQHVLSALALVALEDPTERRAITILNPGDLDPPTELLDAMLTGLRGNPLLDPMTVDEVFSSVAGEGAPNGAPATRELSPYSPPAPPVGPASYRETQTRLDHFRSLVGPADPIVLRGERSLLVCESSTLTGPAGLTRARATLKSVDISIDAFISRIRVPRPSTITLTSQSGEIPLTFRNDTGRPVDVYLELSSAKLTFPAGATRTVRLDKRSTTVRVPVESRTSGTFPLQLSVMSADATLPVANSTFRVRSTAFSTVGIALMVGAAVFLVAWWGLHIRRNRRPRRHA
jgi:Family of unknown function (DUF6049)